MRGSKGVGCKGWGKWSPPPPPVDLLGKFHVLIIHSKWKQTQLYTRITGKEEVTLWWFA